MPVPTHVNAYKADLAEKEAQYAALGGDIEQLKETIATMEAGTADTPINDEAQAEADAEEKRLADLNREELEAEAKKAGVEDPAAAASNEELAAETVAAQRDESVQGEPEAAADGGSVDESTPEAEVPAEDAPEAPAADEVETPAEDTSEPAAEADEPAEEAASSEPVA